MATTLQQLLHAPDQAAIERALRDVGPFTVQEINAAMARDPVIQAARRTSDPAAAYRAIQASPLYPAIVRLAGKPEYSYVPALGQMRYDPGVPGGKLAATALLAGFASPAFSHLFAPTAAVPTTAGGVLPSHQIGTGMIGPIAGGTGTDIATAIGTGTVGGVSSLANTLGAGGAGGIPAVLKAILKASPALLASIPALRGAFDGGGGDPGGILGDPQLRDLLLQSLGLQLKQQQRLDPLQEATTALAGRLLPTRLVDTSRITGADYGTRGTPQLPPDYLAELAKYTSGLH